MPKWAGVFAVGFDAFVVFGAEFVKKRGEGGKNE